MTSLQDTITSAFANRDQLSPDNIDAELSAAIFEALDGLQTGEYRVAYQDESSKWQVNQWLKKAVLLYFKTQKNTCIEGGLTHYFDKVPLQYEHFSDQDFATLGARIVPPACVRIGAHIGKNCVIMPSYINIGAYVGSNTLIDTWATVGSCAYVGNNVHLSGGAGIGGVLEPLQANPTIIEDNCFIGARSEIVEGVIIEKNSVISMGVFIGQSTKIYDRNSGEIYYGRVPSGSVVVPGAMPAADGSHSLYCAVIVKRVDEKTREKTSLNELLRHVE